MMYCYVTIGNCKMKPFVLVDPIFSQRNNPGYAPDINICVDKHLLKPKEKKTQMFM